MHVHMYSHRYMVDAADHEKLDASKNELHSLLEKPQLAGIPVSQTRQKCDEVSRFQRL